VSWAGLKMGETGRLGDDDCQLGIRNSAGARRLVVPGRRSRVKSRERWEFPSDMFFFY
jgi:hypothetical protein